MIRRWPAGTVFPGFVAEALAAEMVRREMLARYCAEEIGRRISTG